MTGFIRGSILAAVSVLAACSAGALAAKAPTIDAGRAAVVKALSDCRAITDDTARLACYDKAAGALDQAESKGDVVVIDRAQVKAVRRQAFGFNLPSINIFGHPAKGEEGFDHVGLLIDRFSRNGEGRLVLFTTDNQVWKLTDSEDLADDPHQGSTLLIQSGVLGNYFCKVDRSPNRSCERVR